MPVRPLGFAAFADIRVFEGRPVVGYPCYGANYLVLMQQRRQETLKWQPSYGRCPLVLVQRRRQEELKWQFSIGLCRPLRPLLTFNAVSSPDLSTL
jgi:hypothetical protein